MHVEEPAVGERLGRYLLQRELGRGAMGLVFLAEDTILQQQVCIKVLHPAVAGNAEAAERFRREIVLARRISHRGVCRVHDLHEEAGVRFITMEHIDGAPLRELVHRSMRAVDGRDERIPVDQALRITRSLCEGLAAAHAVGVLHRDLKPGNIIVRANTDDDVVILDFGIAIAEGAASTITKPGFALGTRHYIAPEVWAGQPASTRSDLFAVGVILFQLLTGRHPWAASGHLDLIQTMRRQPAPPPSSSRLDVSYAVDAIVQHALAVDPARRAVDALRFAAACDAAIGPPLRDDQEHSAPRPVTGLHVMRFDVPAVATPLPMAQSAGGRLAELAPEAWTERRRAGPLLSAPLSPALQPPPSPPRPPADDLDGPVSVEFIEIVDEPPIVFRGEASGVAIGRLGRPVRGQAGLARVASAARPVLSPPRGSRRQSPRRTRIAIAAAAGIGLGAIFAWSSADDSGDADAAALDVNVDADADAALPVDVDDALGDPSPPQTRTLEAADPDPIIEPAVTATPPPASTSRAPRPPARPARAVWLEAEGALDRALVRNGLLLDDDDSIARFRRESLSRARGGRFTAAAASAREGVRRADAITVDRAFVVKKLDRFDRRFEAVGDRELRASLSADAQRARQELRAGRFDAANRALNAAFAKLPAG